MGGQERLWLAQQRMVSRCIMVQFVTCIFTQLIRLCIDRLYRPNLKCRGSNKFLDSRPSKDPILAKNKRNLEVLLKNLKTLHPTQSSEKLGTKQTGHKFYKACLTKLSPSDLHVAVPPSQISTSLLYSWKCDWW